MQKTKKKRKLPIRQAENKENKWKSKAIARRIENEHLRKRLKEVTQSRDKWKNKWKHRNEKASKSDLLSGEKAYRHRYSLDINLLVLAMSK